MSVEKSELKKEITHEIGCRLDDALDEAQREIHRWEGAKTSLNGAKLAVEQLLAHVAQDVKTSKLSNEGAEAAQLYIRRASGVLDNLRLKAEIHEQRSYGRVDGLKQAVTTVQKIYDKTEERLRAIREYEEQSEQKSDQTAQHARPTGARPINLVAALKQSERTIESEDVASVQEVAASEKEQHPCPEPQTPP